MSKAVRNQSTESLLPHLEREFLRLKQKNENYSLRSFARRLGIPASALSDILRGKRKISPRVQAKIIPRLGLSAKTLANLCAPATSVLKYQSIDRDQFHLIADWFYFAVFNLFFLEDFQACPFWISGRLGISTLDAKSALERLEKVGMIARDENGALKPTGNDFQTTTDLVDLSIRRGHYQNLELARRSLDEDPVSERDFSEITMAIDPEDLPLAKERIKVFRRSLCAELESRRKREVYRFCLQLFPLTRRKNTKGKPRP